MAQQEKPGRTLMSDASSVSRTFQPVIYHSHPNLSPPTFPTRVSCGQQACTNGTTRLYIQLHLTHLVYLPHPVSATRTNKAMPHHCRCQLHKNLSEATRRISFVPRYSLRSLSLLHLASSGRGRDGGGSCEPSMAFKAVNVSCHAVL